MEEFREYLNKRLMSLSDYAKEVTAYPAWMTQEQLDEKGYWTQRNSLKAPSASFHLEQDLAYYILKVKPTQNYLC
jgi:hypothetical protein